MDLTALKVSVYKKLPPFLKQAAVRLATPNFTIGVVGLVTVDGSQLLLVRPSYRKGWVPPGGFLDRGEQPIAGLERELQEELGLDLTFAPWHRVAFDAKRRGVGFVAVATVLSELALTPTSPEILEARWFPLDALPPMPTDFYEGLHPEDLEAVRSAGRLPSGR